MPYTDSKGRVWMVSGVDSIAEDNGQPLLEVCKHTPNSTYTETDEHIICVNCERRFAKIHPTTAEQIVRDLESQIIELCRVIEGV